MGDVPDYWIPITTPREETGSPIPLLIPPYQQDLAIPLIITKMNEPSDGVPPHLLPHVHLVSNFRYPVFSPDIQGDALVDYLLQAMNITRNQATMNWTFLDAPQDGTVLLVWQPTQLGLNFASDGYLWADPEQAFYVDSKGFTIEMYVHRSGFQPGKDQVTAHSRRRYRLSRTSNPNVPIDPSLWLVHYLPTDVSHRYPTNQIPMTSQMQVTINARRHLMSQGQLVRKEFMLYDRNNWPSINVPGAQTPGSGPQRANPYARPPAAMSGRNIQQAPLYPPQQATQTALSSSPSKRPRMGAPNQMPSTVPVTSVPAPAGYVPPAATTEEEEDTSYGDSVDHASQRELSTIRYRQHHNWMDEVLSSPYAMGQIKPSDLKLDSLLERVLGIKKSTSSNSADPPGKLDALTKSTNERLAAIQAEMDKMDKRHAKMMQRSETSLMIEAAEKELRCEFERPGSGSEIWRIAKADENKRKPEDIVKEVEAALGKRIVKEQPVRLVQKGGLQEGGDEKENGRSGQQQTRHMSTTTTTQEDVRMNDDAGHLLDVYETPGASVQTPVGSHLGGSSSIENPTAYLQASATGQLGGSPSIENPTAYLPASTTGQLGGSSIENPTTYLPASTTGHHPQQQLNTGVNQPSVSFEQVLPPLEGESTIGGSPNQNNRPT